MNIITAQNISCSYNQAVDVLEDVSFNVQENDFIGLIGPNGGGKSTLLKLILGLIKPRQGTINVFGKEPASARDKIGYVPQYSRIDLDYPINVFDATISGLLGKKKLGSRYSKSEKDKAREVLREFELLNLRSRTIGELSGGQRQRVLIARALVRQPQLLLLDEPTSNVDIESGSNLYDLLNKLNKKMTIIIASHDIGAISRHINKIFCLNRRISCNHAQTISDQNGIDSNRMKKIYHEAGCPIS
ncbi:MAG: ABC transporter ATP-binding protein [bacterium]